MKNNRDMSNLFTPLIAEGMADGSIRPGNPELLAELTVLLFNVWMLPPLYPMNEERFEEKSMMIKECLDALGFPLLNEEFMDTGDAYATLLDLEDS